MTTLNFSNLLRDEVLEAVIAHARGFSFMSGVEVDPRVRTDLKVV